MEEALKYYSVQRRDDPLSLNASFGVQFTLDFLGRTNEAETEYQRSKDLPGGRGTLEWRAITRVMAPEDEARLRQRLAEYIANGSTWMAFDPQLLQVLDRPEEEHSRSCARPSTIPSIRMLRAWARSHIGRNISAIGDLALEALRRDCVEMRGLTVGEMWHPLFAGLRKDARFKNILRDTGLVGHWRATGKWGDFARPLGNDDFEIIR